MSIPSNTSYGPPNLVQFYWADDLPSIKVEWLVDDLFPNKALSLIIGASQAGKSYLAIDLAVAIATGRPFLGKRVLKAGVLYIATEGQNTIHRRLIAARQGMPLDAKLLAFIQEPPADFMKAEDVDRIIATAKVINGEMLKATGFPLKMIIIDTMISGFAIGDWNNVAETTAAMKILRKIKDEVGVAVTAVHHHGKDATRGAAGSYALTAHPDSILSVFKKDIDGAVKQRWVTLTKSRFGETGRKILFNLEKASPDHHDGDHDDEVFVVLAGKSTADPGLGSKDPKLSQADACFLTAFQSALAVHGFNVTRSDTGRVHTGVRLSDVKESFAELYKPKGNGGDPAEAIRRAWGRSVAKHSSRGTIMEGTKDGEALLINLEEFDSEVSG